MEHQYAPGSYYDWSLMANIPIDNREDPHFSAFRDKLIRELEQGILPFWLKYSLDQKHGGFYGRVEKNGKAVPEAPKGLILNTRILWSFSAAYNALGNTEYLKIADRAWSYLCEYFIDTEFGGAYWMLDCRGVPVDDKKKVYGHAFFIYALAEYYRATSKITALDLAVELFHIVESQFFDPENSGYLEAALRTWDKAEDIRLSDIDMNEKKSMNAHLHVLEAYTNLVRVWNDSMLRRQLTSLLLNFKNHIINSSTAHFNLFFNERWEVKSQVVSPGHDIEGSWLLCEAANILDDNDLKEEFHRLAISQAEAVYVKGVNPDGSLIYEIHSDGRMNTEKHWWVQAEGMVGFFNAWQLTGNKRFYQALLGVWSYIENNLIDAEHGEWYYKINGDSKVDWGDFKISEWKGPYHNTRACLEVARRLDTLRYKYKDI